MKKIASKSNHKYQHCSMIFAGNRLISYGYNNNDVHSEVMAINRMKAVYRNNHKILPRNLHIVNLMIKKHSGNFGNSAPCNDCIGWITIVGIRTITYFNSSGKAVQIRSLPWTLVERENYT